VSAVPLAVIVVVGALLSYRSHKILRQDRDMVVHTYQVIGSVRDALLATEEAETGQRGFIITGQPSFLEPYKKARSQTIPAVLADLGRLLIRNKGQQVRLARLRSLIEEKLNQIQTTVEARRDRDFEAARSLIASEDNDRVMNKIRAIASEMDDAEETLLKERAGRAANSEMRIIWLAALTATLSVAARIWIGVDAAKRPT
jgi:methyl-accepting chemotaxis protein